MMACTLLREGGFWVASWTMNGVQCMCASPDRYRAAQALFLATGVWLAPSASEVAS